MRGDVARGFGTGEGGQSGAPLPPDVALICKGAPEFGDDGVGGFGKRANPVAEAVTLPPLPAALARPATA